MDAEGKLGEKQRKRIAKVGQFLFQINRIPLFVNDGVDNWW
jgi:hypothetical protein